MHLGYYKRFSDSASTYSVSNNTTTQIKPVDEGTTTHSYSSTYLLTQFMYSVYFVCSSNPIDYKTR